MPAPRKLSDADLALLIEKYGALLKVLGEGFPERYVEMMKSGPDHPDHLALLMLFGGLFQLVTDAGTRITPFMERLARERAAEMFTHPYVQKLMNEISKETEKNQRRKR